MKSGKKSIMETNSIQTTPDAVAVKMAWLAKWYGQGETRVLDACCGIGCITRELLKNNLTVSAFDIDPSNTAVHNHHFPECYAVLSDFRKLEGMQWPLIVSHPPFGKETLIEFIDWLVRSLIPGGRGVLLLPDRYVDDEAPEELIRTLARLKILDRSKPKDMFSPANESFEIVVVEKTV